MKYSKQREIILEYLRSIKTHPTAETIYEEVKKEDKKISLGTVYRNLDKLSDMGLIQWIKMANEKDRFDGDVSLHYHGKCIKCNSVIDIFLKENIDLSIDEHVKNETNINVVSHDIIFNVICPNCDK